MKIRRINGIAGQYAYEVTEHLDYSKTTFVGSVYGPTVIMVLEGKSDSFQDIVIRPERFGEKLDEQWVRNFYGVSDDVTLDDHGVGA